MQLKTVLLGITAAVTLASCAQSPTGRSQLQLYPSSELNKMGAASYEEMRKEGKINQDEQVNAYVRCVTDALVETLPGDYAQMDWEVTVFDEPTVNAFALPGGYIGVYNGLLETAENQHQLAAVIGHEIGHVIAEHSNERISSNMLVGLGLQIGGVIASTQMDSDEAGLLMAALGIGAQVGVLLPYSRTHESESDELGLEYMADAGFQLDQAPELWRNMKAASGGSAPPELLSTHPNPDTRIQDLEAQIPSLQSRYQQAVAAGNTPNCQRPASLDKPAE
ncbi:M48 family metallopeptidase [Idiomarina sp. UBA4520]|jgi:predicted Zn-dependent protease|uniref:M48 family metallopeptidase n=1 Tax=Idiomarina sp. UBA4520 TaxID=1946647 RepID=UPI000B113B35|nr:MULTISPECIES: M48 family metallopeptidase [unclassified Idiomarina]MBF38396.1 peptidase [Idiomarinaceae bacterium]|tara:strand:+ start:33043 stop:33879 length:837 start_codon:yes stop_codon:yes gene_type:complete